MTINYIKNNKLSLRVIPHSSQLKLVKENSQLKIYLTAVADDNKANLQLIKFFKKEYGLNNTEINSYEEAIVVHDILMKYKSQRAAKKAKRANSPPLEVHIAEVRPTGSHSVYGGIEFSDDPLKWHSKP